MNYPVPVTGLVNSIALRSPERPKLYGVLAVLSAIGFNKVN